MPLRGIELAFGAGLLSTNVGTLHRANRKNSFQQASP